MMYSIIILRREHNTVEENLQEKVHLIFHMVMFTLNQLLSKLYGRIHFDKSNSFILNDSGLQGLYEIARICRMPLHTASRASIGKCLSSLQFYYATQEKRY